MEITSDDAADDFNNSKTKMKKNKNAIRLSDHFTYRKLLTYCFPTIIMMVFTSVYGVVDGLFVSNFASKSAFAAINLIMPVLVILECFGTMLGTGGTALISKTLGENKPEEANRYFSIIIESAAIIGIAVTIAGYVFMPRLASALGATPQLMDDAVTYGRVCVLFITAPIFQFMFQTFMSLAEKPKLGLAITLGAGVTNIILDAVFVAGLHMGVTGAAVATGISEIFGGLVPLIYFAGKNSSRLRFRPVKPQLRPVLRASYNGISELMTNISASIVSMVYNLQLLRYAGADGVAAYGVVMYVQFIFLAVMFGYAVGVSPVIGYHYGAQNHKEMNNLLTKSMKMEYIGGLIMFAAAQALARPISILFVGYDQDLLDMTVHAFRIFLFAFLLSGGNMFASAFFTALSNGTISAVISFVRTLVFELISVMLLPMVLGLNGIWCAVFVAEIASFIMSWAFLLGQNRKYHYFPSRSRRRRSSTNRAAGKTETTR